MKRKQTFEPIERKPNPVVRFVSLVFLIGLVVSLGFFVWFSWIDRNGDDTQSPMTPQSTETSRSNDAVDDNNGQATGTRSFESEEIGVRFRYPAEFGTAELKEPFAETTIRGHSYSLVFSNTLTDEVYPGNRERGLGQYSFAGGAISADYEDEGRHGTVWEYKTFDPASACSRNGNSAACEVLITGAGLTTYHGLTDYFGDEDYTGFVPLAGNAYPVFVLYFDEATKENVDAMQLILRSVEGI